MSNNRLYSLWYLLGFVFLTSCYKIDWPGGDPIPAKKYDVEACNNSIYSPAHPFLFVKTYDYHSRYAREIDASVFNMRAPTDLLRYQLRIIYLGSEIYLVNKTNASDTSVWIHLNNKGRVETCYAPGDLGGQYSFKYKNNRLVSMEWNSEYDSWTDSFSYDNYGNILSRTLSASTGVADIISYQYDYSKKAKHQFYGDELKRIDNAFTLMGYLGLFPELNPVHLRTYVEMGPEGGFKYWKTYLYNHQIDNLGRLLKYDVSRSVEHPTPEYSVTIKWKAF